jgi:hypothetical protein
MDHIEEAVKACILKEFGPGQDTAKVTASTPLVPGEIRVRLAVEKLVAFFEERFGIPVKAQEVDVGHLDTTIDIAKLVRSQVERRP